MTAGISTPLPASSGSARAEHCADPCVLDSDPELRGGPTLNEVVSSAWAALSWGAPAACPVCDGRLVPQPDSNAARCRDCGSALS
jgi:hypothetical protein